VVDRGDPLAFAARGLELLGMEYIQAKGLKPTLVTSVDGIVDEPAALAEGSA
jgi:hypothetical protein